MVGSHERTHYDKHGQTLDHKPDRGFIVCCRFHFYRSSGIRRADCRVPPRLGDTTNIFELCRAIFLRCSVPFNQLHLIPECKDIEDSDPAVTSAIPRRDCNSCFSSRPLP